MKAPEYMQAIESNGWEKILADTRRESENPKLALHAYSEFMPPPRLGLSPYGGLDNELFRQDDPCGWNVSEVEEEYELQPGLKHLAGQIMRQIKAMGTGQPAYHIAGHGNENIRNNPYWPEDLSRAAATGALHHERFVAFLPLALSRTQDDKGRVRWTFFGSSEQGPERVFWKSFFTAPGQERPESGFTAFINNLLKNVYSEKTDNSTNPLRIGFRILPQETGEILPSWSRKYIMNEPPDSQDVRFLLTFKPFSELSPALRKRYLSGRIFLLPFPGSLVFWGMPNYLKLAESLPMAGQIPLLRLAARHNSPGGLRVPQTGWLHEPHIDMHTYEVQKELLLDSYHRSHRWDKTQRHLDELPVTESVEKVVKVLFSTDLEVLGLYNKPMAKNCQIWTNKYNILLNGPEAGKTEIRHAEETLMKGGLFGYRFHFPAMRAGNYEVYWHRPLVAFVSGQEGKAEVIGESPTGYLTAYNTKEFKISSALEFWPRIKKRDAYLSALRDFENKHDHYSHQTAFNIITLFDAWNDMGRKALDRNFALRLLTLAKDLSLEEWLEKLPEKTGNARAASTIKKELEKIIGPAALPSSPSREKYLTYSFTATRKFEEDWWNDIRLLAHGDYANKDNADCVQDEFTLNYIKHHRRDLEKLGDYLISRHKNAISAAGMEKKALCGEMPFKWETDFEFDQFGGWLHNQRGHSYERNIAVIIPGKNRSRAVIMADHYDTAYMEDVYYKSRGGIGARVAAAGADDNHSATATLLQAAPIFLELSRKGQLKHDIWLVHLTGEEFPSDCMGARNLCKSLIEKNLVLNLESGEQTDLSGTKIEGVFVLDMIAHNRDHQKDIFQISPGKSQASLKLAYQAHIANELWNAGTHEWNKIEERSGHKRSERVHKPVHIPAAAPHLPVYGNVRTHDNPHSSLYNTDGQIFSDTGVPVVLFMEDYDINRSGYHDTKDTMSNIDLDYGSAVAAIAIEAAAQTAMLPNLQ